VEGPPPGVGVGQGRGGGVRVGVAGGRVYAFRSRETTGAFVEGRPFTPDEVRDTWTEIVRS